MRRKLFLQVLVAVAIALAGANTAFGVFSVGVRVAATNDDAEESVVGGGVELDSSDLELGYDGTSLQTVGVRFAGVHVPAGAEITKAYVQFSVDDKDNDYHATPVSLR